MGVGGISIWQLLIILVIVLLLFGTKRLKSIGADLGNAVKGFRSAMSESDKTDEAADSTPISQSAEKRTAEGDATTAKPGAVNAQDKPRV